MSALVPTPTIDVIRFVLFNIYNFTFQILCTCSHSHCPPATQCHLFVLFNIHNFTVDCTCSHSHCPAATYDVIFLCCSTSTISLFAVLVRTRIALPQLTMSFLCCLTSTISLFAVLLRTCIALLQLTMYFFCSVEHPQHVTVCCACSHSHCPPATHNVFLCLTSTISLFAVLVCTRIALPQLTMSSFCAVEHPHHLIVHILCTYIPSIF